MALFRTYGPNPRTIISILQCPEDEADYIDDAINAATNLAKDFPRIFQQIERANFSSDISKIFYLRPHPERRSKPVLSIPTSFLAKTLGVSVASQVAVQQNSFFSILTSHPSLRSAAGWLFENYAHAYFSDKPMQVYHSDHPNPIFVPVPERRIAGRTALKNIQSPFNFYWRPREPNYTGIDALIRSGNIVWALQFTISTSHCSSTDGLEKARNDMGFKKNTDWRLVMVGTKLSDAVSARDNQRLTNGWEATPVYACELPLGEFQEQSIIDSLDEVSTNY